MRGVLDGGEGVPDPGIFTRDIYFGSFCDVTNHNEDASWRNFGENGQGVRLELDIEPARTARLRKMVYGSAKTLLGELNDDLRARINKTFTLRGVWTLASFYLPRCLQDEMELRLLVPDYPDAQLGCVVNGGWPIALDGTDPYCRMTVTSVTVGPRMTDIQRGIVSSHAATRHWPVV
jgi:hypothetical protein